MTLPRLISLTILALTVLMTGAVAQTLTEAPDWQTWALANLTKNGEALTEAQLNDHKFLRCIKMNNYFCLMHSSPGNPWRGSVGRDGAGHAVFSDPKWSVRGIVRDQCSKHRRNLDTAIEIAETFSPWCDTLGTVGVRTGWGRTCQDDGPTPPEGFSGNLCTKPAGNVPAAGQCQSCNCPSSIANAMVRNTGIAITDDLELFADNGSVNLGRMKTFLSNLSAQEIGGLRPSDAVLEAGIAEAGPCT